jgi:GDP-D-mannose dehydratase
MKKELIELGWATENQFKELVRIMMDEDLVK